MSSNIDNALRGLQDARSAIFVETGDIVDAERMALLIEAEELLNEVEGLLKAYG